MPSVCGQWATIRLLGGMERGIPMNMTASEVIEEIERLPDDEQQRVISRVQEMAEASLPESFVRGMAEAELGELVDMKDGDFDNPPA